MPSPAPSKGRAPHPETDEAASGERAAGKAGGGLPRGRLAVGWIRKASIHGQVHAARAARAPVATLGRARQ